MDNKFCNLLKKPLFKLFSKKNETDKTIIISLIKKYSKDPNKPALYYVTFTDNIKEGKPWMSVKTLKEDMELFIKVWKDCNYNVVINEQ